MRLLISSGIRVSMKIAKNGAWQELVGHRIVMLRAAKGVKQAQLARHLKISPQRLSNYERGERPLDIEQAIAICENLQGTLDYLYRGIHAGLPFEVIQRLASEEGRLELRGTDGLKN